MTSFNYSILIKPVSPRAAQLGFILILFVFNFLIISRNAPFWEACLRAHYVKMKESES